MCPKQLFESNFNSNRSRLQRDTPENDRLDLNKSTQVVEIYRYILS